MVFPPGQTDSNPIIRVASTTDSLLVHTDKPWRPFTWLDSRSTRKGVVLFNQYFDLDKGLIVEGHIKARILNTKSRIPGRPMLVFIIEGADKGPGTVILLEVGEPQRRESHRKIVDKECN